ncbi:MAG: universal stress protein [Bacillota bacterium]|nr:universal stress protein [Bacillota bacterium]MDW7729155.1 universal stress protein [Bacillota bacterium]
MKILVCLDGSEKSKKVLEKASQIAAGCQVNDLAVIHVYEPRLDPTSPSWGSRSHSLTDEDNAYMCRLREQEKEERQKYLQEAVKFFEEKSLKARAILKEGHPAHTIVSTATEEGSDMIVIGSRGLGGLKKVFLGSVSSAVIQEADNCTVAVVK